MRPYLTIVPGMPRLVHQAPTLKWSSCWSVSHSQGGDCPLKLNLAEAKARLTDLVRRAEAGEDVVLMRHGKAVARIVSIVQRPTQEQRVAVIAAIRKRAAGRDQGGMSSDRRQDVLYGDDGLPT